MVFVLSFQQKTIVSPLRWNKYVPYNSTIFNIYYWSFRMSDKLIGVGSDVRIRVQILDNGQTYSITPNDILLLLKCVQEAEESSFPTPITEQA